MGTKLMKKSVSLDRLYGTDLQVGGTSNISGTIQVLDTAGIARITLDSASGLNVIDNAGTTVLQAIISGASIGDVVLGNYGGASGLFYDKSTGTFTVKGGLQLGAGSSLGATTINADYITTGTLSADRIGATSITADKLNVSTLSAITANAGTLTAGTINGLTVIINHQTGGGDPGNGAYLRWSGGSRMWEDNASELGINSIGTPMYIYVDSYEKIVIPSSGQITMRGGVYADGNLNVTSDAAFAGYLTKSGTAANIKFDGEVIRFYNDTPTLEMSIHTEDGGKIYTEKNEINLGGHTLKLTGDVTLP